MSMGAEGHLYRAQAALSCLEHLACFYSEEANVPPANFGFGLSVILDHINDDVTAAYDEYTKEEDPE
jgi:hypothetical protein